MPHVRDLAPINSDLFAPDGTQIRRITRNDVLAILRSLKTFYINGLDPGRVAFDWRDLTDADLS